MHDHFPCILIAKMIATVVLLLLFSTYALDNLKSNDPEVSNTMPKMNEEIKEEPLPPEKKRVPVKLNMKQGLIMNQVVTAYALTNSPDALCKNHSKEFQAALRAFEPWALKMFDSSSKMQSGVLAGNMVEFGSFSQCVKIDTDSDYGPIRGKHCIINVQPTMDIIKKIVMMRNVSEQRFEIVKNGFEGAGLKWSVCVPDSCSYEDVLDHFNKTILSMTEGLSIKVFLDKYDCYALSDEQPLHSSDWLILYCIFSLLGISALCTAVDILRRKTGASPNRIVSIFSAYSNTEHLISAKSGDGDLDCLNGIRFLSIVYVVSGHRFLMALFFPTVNAMEVLDWLTTWGSTIIVGGTVSVDTFFLISGLLVSYHYFNFKAKGGKFNLALFYLHRYVRLTPSYMAVALFFATLTPHLGSGPLWKKIAMYMQYPCKYYWFTTMLYIQNYVNPAHLCLIPTWYLVCDVFYYTFSPIIMYPLWKWKTFGKINFIVLYILSVAINFYLALIHEYRAGQLIDNNLTKSHYFTKHYIVPHIRASTYILGVGFGYILHKYKDKTIKMNYLTLIAGWCISIALMSTVILGNNKFQIEGYVYEKWEASAFISMTRSAWVIGIMWIIWVCRAGCGGPVNTLLSAHVFHVLGRLAYSLFLIHMVYQFLSGGASKLPIYFSNITSVEKALGDLGIVLSISFFLTIFVEYPCVRFSLLFFSMTKKKVEPENEKVKK